MDTHINDIIRPIVPLERNHAARERIDCVLTAGGVRALQKLGRYTDTERGSYLVVKLPLEAMDRAADLETGFRRGLYDTCSQACNSLLAWNTRMGFSSPLQRVFFLS